MGEDSGVQKKMFNALAESSQPDVMEYDVISTPGKRSSQSNGNYEGKKGASPLELLKEIGNSMDKLPINDLVSLQAGLAEQILNVGNRLKLLIQKEHR
jgi:uncharacterized protein YuzB (UPF0349 family)